MACQNKCKCSVRFLIGSTFEEYSIFFQAQSQSSYLPPTGGSACPVFGSLISLPIFDPSV